MIVTERVGDASVPYEINNDEDLKLYEKLLDIIDKRDVVDFSINIKPVEIARTTKEHVDDFKKWFIGDKEDNKYTSKPSTPYKPPLTADWEDEMGKHIQEASRRAYNTCQGFATNPY